MHRNIQRLSEQLNSIIIGKEPQVKLAVVCLIAGGHLLIEDLPGVGKTTLSHALAMSLGLKFTRVQFTSDLLPADITGISVFNRERQQFEFHPGPVFSQVLLADEINRATPKSQSALLEAMEEGQISADGVSHRLPLPFFVIATQNPSHQLGTHPLPESQLDRFLMRISLGYPDREAERALLKGDDRRTLMNTMGTAMSLDAFLTLHQQTGRIFVSDKLVDYILTLAAATRHSGLFAEGMSPRASLALVQAARAWALTEGRDHVLPEDVQAVFIPVVAHRLRVANTSQGRTETSATLLRKILQETAV